MHEVLVNRLGGLSLPRKSVVRLTDHPDMTFDVYRGRKTTMQQMQQNLATFSQNDPQMELFQIYVTFFTQIDHPKWLPLPLLKIAKI